MLAKKYRLAVQTAIGKKGKEFQSKNFLVKIFNSQNPYARFGVVLKKGSVKKASDRNRIRRAIFNSILISQKDFNFPESDFLIIAGPSLSVMSSAEIKKEIDSAFGVIMKRNNK